VAHLEAAARKAGGTAYVHCTAGIGRAPAVALAWMWWTKGIPVDEGYSLLTGLRRCSPKVAAIRAAAVDILFGWVATPVEISLRRRGVVDSAQVAGLDVGWGQTLDMDLKKDQSGYVLTRELPAGKYMFKFVVVRLSIWVFYSLLSSLLVVVFFLLALSLEIKPNQNSQTSLLTPLSFYCAGWTVVLLCRPPHHP
jgi:hypothetical protein